MKLPEDITLLLLAGGTGPDGADTGTVVMLSWAIGGDIVRDI